jgi:NAD(P)-dependent dehydrogenase (short-subunit alcohol dehydrogenase family)
MPDEPTVLGLLALLLLQDARREARVDADGRPVLLADQDRTRWDAQQIKQGVELVGAALRRTPERPNAYVVQAERYARLDFSDLNWERRPYQPSRAYNDSKLANLLFTAELQRRLTAAGSAVLAHAAHPGLVATNIDRHDRPRRASGILWAIAVRLLAQDAQRGALPTLYAAVADIPANSFTGPDRLSHMRGAPELISRSGPAQDADVARRLWELAEQFTGVGFPF